MTVNLSRQILRAIISLSMAARRGKAKEVGGSGDSISASLMSLVHQTILNRADTALDRERSRVNVNLYS